jgi:two-component system phosphate regulon sensor histidine kinase PhoR
MGRHGRRSGGGICRLAAWALLVAVGVGLAGWTAGGWAAARRAARAGGRLREAARRLLDRARALGFEAHTPLGGEAEALPAELERFRFWLDEQWRRSEEERRRLAAVLEGLTEGIVLLDRYGRVLLANPVAQALWPRLAPRLHGRHQIELFQDAACDRALSEAMASGRPREAEITRPGPPRRHWRVRVLPLGPHQAPELQVAPPPPEEGAAGALVVLQDITQERALERTRRDFVANVSHELQTPLTSVRGYAETLLREDLTPEQRRRFLGHILREADRMAALVRDLLALAELEAPRWVQATPVRMDELAREVAAAEGGFAQQRRVDLRVEAEPAVVLGRAEELRRAVDNLVRNALAYTPAGGRVQVRVRRVGAEVHLEVEDTGIGIPAEHLPRIFERFYRVDRGRSRETGGTGLGLAIVKHTAEGHGGQVRVSSTVGQGSTFVLVLPAAQAPAGPGAADGPG